MLRPRLASKAHNTDLNNFSPSLGFAWTPATRPGVLSPLMGSGDFVIRAGYNRAYSRPGLNDYTGRLGNNPGDMARLTPTVAPGATVKGPFDVKVAQTDNFAHWQSLYAANHDAKAFIGLCAPDVTSLGKLNSQIGDKLTAGGYDTTSANLAAIGAGHAYVTLGQNPFVQGYLPILMMYDAITKHAKLPKGFVESGTEIVDAGGATEPYDLGHISFKQVDAPAGSPSKTAAYYGQLFKGPKAPLKNWQKAMEPLANESK